MDDDTQWDVDEWLEFSSLPDQKHESCEDEP